LKAAEIARLETALRADGDLELQLHVKNVSKNQALVPINEDFVDDISFRKVPGALPPYTFLQGTGSSNVNFKSTTKSIQFNYSQMFESGTTFLGDRLLIRHGEVYSAKQRAADKKAELANKGCAPAPAS